MTNYIYLKKRLIIYIFMIKILFNFKCIYMYELMHVLYASFFFNNLTNYLYFYNKNCV